MSENRIGYSAKLDNGDFLVGESDHILVVASKEQFFRSTWRKVHAICLPRDETKGH